MTQAAEGMTPLSSTESSRQNLEISKGVEVIDALNHAYPEYLQARLTDPWEIADRQETQEVWDQTFGKGKYQTTYTDVQGIKQTRYLPMHGLINWLSKRQKSGAFAEDFAHDFNVLERSNESVRAKDQRKKETEVQQQERLEARVAQERARIIRLRLAPEDKAEEIARERVQTVIREFIPVRESRRNERESLDSTSHLSRASSSEPREIRVGDSGTRTHPWETATLEGIARQTEKRQDEAPWGKPDLPKDVEIRTEDALSKFKVKPKIASQGDALRGKEPQDISEALLNFENAFTGLQSSPGDESSQASAKDALRITLVRLEELTGNRDAVKEFLDARKERVILSAQDDGSSTSEIKILDAKAKEEKTLGRLYKLAEEKGKPPPPPSAFQGLSLEPQDAKIRREEDFARAEKTVDWSSKFDAAIKASETPTPESTPKEIARKIIDITIGRYENALTQLNAAEANEDREMMDFWKGVIADSKSELTKITNEAAVDEFVQAHFTRSMMLSQKAGEIPEDTLEEAKEGERKTLNRLYELAEARSQKGSAPAPESESTAPAAVPAGSSDSLAAEAPASQEEALRTRVPTKLRGRRVLREKALRFGSAKPDSIPPAPEPGASEDIESAGPIPGLIRRIPVQRPASDEFSSETEIADDVDATGPRPGLPEFGPDGGTPLGFGEPGFDPNIGWPEAEGGLPPPLSPPEIRKYYILLARNDAELSERIRKEAEDYLREEMKRGSIFNPLNWKRKIGYRLIENGMRHHFIERIREARLRSGIAYADVDLARNAASTVKAEHIASTIRDQDTTIEAIAHGEGKNQAVEDLGLKKTIFREIVEPTRLKLEKEGVTESTVAQMQKLLGDFAKRHRGEKGIREIFGSEGSPYGETAYYFATNLLDIAEQMNRDSASHEFSNEMLSINIASAKSISNSEVKLNPADRFVRFAQQRKTLGAINPAVLGGAFSLALSPGIVGINTVTRLPGVGIFSGALSGSLMAAARRNYDLKMDMAAHRVAIKYGEQIPEGAKRREALQQFTYQTESVLNLLYVDRIVTPDSKHPKAMAGDGRSMATLLDSELTDLTVPENQIALMRRMAEIRIRLDSSEHLGTSLLKFESSANTSMGRLELIRALATGELALHGGRGIIEEDIDTLNRLSGEWKSEFTTDIASQDKAFRSYRLKQSLSAAARGAVMGATAGLAIGETVKVVNRVAQGLNIDFGRLIDDRVDYYREQFRNLSTQNGSQRGIASTGKLATKAQELILQGEQHTGKAGEKLASIASIGDAPAGAPEAFNAASPDSPTETFVDGKKITAPPGTWWQDRDNNGRPDLVTYKNGQIRILLNEFSFDEQGNPQVESGSIWSTDQLSSDSTSTPEVRKVLGKDGAWREMATPIDDRQFYSYDRAGSQGNELLLRDGVYENKAGEKFVVLNMSEMGEGVQSGNNPNPIDVQDVIKRGQAAFAFEIDGKTVVVPDGADGKIDGKLRLNPLDNNPKHFFDGPNGRIQLGDFSKIVVNQDVLSDLRSGTTNSDFNNFSDLYSLGHDGNPGTIAAGRLIERNGETAFQQFAAIQGTGEVPNRITTGFSSETTWTVKSGYIPPIDDGHTPTPGGPDETPGPGETPGSTEKPVETPRPTLEPTPEPVETPTQALETPLPTESPSPSLSPSPDGGPGVIQPILDGLANFQVPEVPVATPFAPRYELEKMQSTARDTSTIPPAGPTPGGPFPPPATPTPRPSVHADEYKSWADTAQKSRVSEGKMYVSPTGQRFELKEIIPRNGGELILLTPVDGTENVDFDRNLFEEMIRNSVWTEITDNPKPTGPERNRSISNIILSSELPELEEFLQSEFDDQLSIGEAIASLQRIQGETIPQIDLNQSIAKTREILPFFASAVVHKINPTTPVIQIPKEVSRKIAVQSSSRAKWALRASKILPKGIRNRIETRIDQGVEKEIEKRAEPISLLITSLANTPGPKDEFIREIQAFYELVRPAGSASEAMRDFSRWLAQSARYSGSSENDYPLLIALTRLDPSLAFRFSISDTPEAGPEILRGIYSFLQRGDINTSPPQRSYQHGFKRSMAETFGLGKDQLNKAKIAEQELPAILEAVYNIIPANGPEFAEKIMNLFKNLAQTSTVNTPIVTTTTTSGPESEANNNTNGGYLLQKTSTQKPANGVKIK